MIKDREEKFKIGLSIQEAASFLREIADSMEQGNIAVDNNNVQVNPFHHISLSYKQDTEKNNFSLKLKYKGRDKKQTYVQPSEVAVEKYKHLKERMKTQFKSIQEALDTGILPEPKLLTDFVEDSKQMCQYKDKGDEYYPRYLKAVNNFEKAAGQEELLSLQAALQSLDNLKQECHELYK